MATTPTLTLCDELVTVLVAANSPSGDDSIERVYEAPNDVGKTTGRKVYVFPGSYDREPADRGNFQYRHRVVVLTVERYIPEGRPTAAWVDARVDFVHDKIFDGLDYSIDGPLKWGSRSVLTLSAGPVDVYDPGYLIQHKIFWSEVEFEFIEIL